MNEDTFTPGTLFSVVSSNPDGKFLRSLAAIMNLISESPTLWQLCETAARQTAQRARSGAVVNNRGGGELFEKHLNELLTDEAQQAISEEVKEQTAHYAGLPWWAFNPLNGIKWELLEGKRAPADYMLHLDFINATLQVPLNLKRGQSTGGDAVAVSTLLRLAQGRPLSDTKRLNVSRTLLGWWAGSEKIRHAEYVIMTVLGDQAAGTVTDIVAQGLMSAQDEDGSLALVRHPSREVAQYVEPVGVIPDDFDVNYAFAEALTPKTNPDDLKLALLRALRDIRGWAPSTTRKYARLLEGLDVEALAAALVAALRDVGGVAGGEPDSKS